MDALLTVGIVAPALNEEMGIQKWLESLSAVLRQVIRTESMRFVVIVVDDGSTDHTALKVRDFDPKEERIEVRCLQLSRNFGHHSAIVAGMKEALTASVDAVITMDSDGEHPVDLIPTLLREWRGGKPIVQTMRRAHDRLSLFKRFTSLLFYKGMAKLSSVKIQAGMADYRLWDGGLLSRLEPWLDSCGSLRLFAQFVAPDPHPLMYDQLIIEGRKSRFTFAKMVELALQSIFYYSPTPVRMIGAFGLLSLIVSLLIFVDVAVGIWFGRTVPGWASMTCAISFFGGTNAICLYILAEYSLRHTFRARLPQFVALGNSRAVSAAAAGHPVAELPLSRKRIAGEG